MKSHIARTLTTVSVFAATATFAAGQQVSPQNTVLLGPGSDLRCRLEKGVRITKAGQSITARVVEPVYIGTTLAIPAGSTVEGHVSSVHKATRSMSRLLSGDFTPPKIAYVSFDRVTFPDGNEVAMRTENAVGITGVQTAKYLPKSQRPGIKQKVKNAAEPLRGPNKLQRLQEAAIKSLPYHPEYLEQGTVFDATLVESIQLPLPVQAVDPATSVDSQYLHLRLLTPVTSDTVGAGTSIEAAVSEPYYGSDHALLYPAGAIVEGTVTKATGAAWLKKNGELMFSFHSVRTPEGISSNVEATVAGVEIPGGRQLAVGEEGELKATTSRLSQITAPLSLIGPSRAAADSTLNKTAWSRASEGRKGFGLIGAGAAQASASTALGFGYFGGAMKIYNAFIAKGENVSLPANTPVLLRINEKGQTQSAMSN
jgi:hypothetical protein